MTIFMRLRIKYLTGVLLLGYGTNTLAKSDNFRHPNVILILADDLAMGDVSFYNRGISRTPNIDKLIENGVSFNQAYSAAPVSAPARASLLTGLYPQVTGCVTLNLLRFPELTRIKAGIPTIADVFRDNGYVTGLIGKWHTGVGVGSGPLDRGFDVFEGYHGFNLHSYNNYELIIQHNSIQVTNKYLTDDLNDRAVSFIREHKDKPFFLHLAHSAPHVPLGAPEEIVESYMKKGLSNDVSTIYAMIEIMDDGLGRLFNELKRLKLWNNTIIIFSSDNGADPSFSRFNMNFTGTKYTVYEGGIHVPFVVCWGNKLSANQSDELIHFTDVVPTLVDLCKLNSRLIEKSDGVSFADMFLSEKPKINRNEKARFWQWNRGVPEYSHNASIRLGDWKLVKPYVTNGFVFDKSNLKPELFNLKNDPGEKHDVSAMNRKIYEELWVMLERWSRDVENERLNYKKQL